MSRVDRMRVMLRELEAQAERAREHERWMAEGVRASAGWSPRLREGIGAWSLLRGLAPEIRAGRVAVWAIDPKGGMELEPGRALFARFCGDEFTAMADLLDEAVGVMQDRARRLSGVTRLHEPTIREPLILVVVDEVATLSAYLPDRKLRDRFAHSLGLLLTQGARSASVRRKAVGPRTRS